MRTKVNTEALTQSLNEFRMSSLGKTFTTEQLKSKLMSLGFNKNTACYIMQHYFPFEKMGNSRLYEVPKDPIHKSILVTIYKKQREYRKEHSNSICNADNPEEEALKLLASKGYEIRRCVGFDIERFASENPVLYRKYLKYETI